MDSLGAFSKGITFVKNNFDKLDKNENGFITQDEIKQYSSNNKDANAFLESLLSNNAMHAQICNAHNDWGIDSRGISKKDLEVITSFMLKEEQIKVLMDFFHSHDYVKEIKDLLTYDLAIGIMFAENSRLNFLERWGYDGSTVGRGQVGQPAYNEVKKMFGEQNIIKICNKNDIEYDGDIEKAIEDPFLETMIILGYLAIKIKNADRRNEGRSDVDVLQVAIGAYHSGLSETGAIRMSQKATKNPIAFTGEWKDAFRKIKKDAVRYIDEVMVMAGYKENSKGEFEKIGKSISEAIISDRTNSVDNYNQQQKPLNSTKIYVIQKGDSLWKIFTRSGGSKVLGDFNEYLKIVAKLNSIQDQNIRSLDRLTVGESIILPLPSMFTNKQELK